MRHRSMDSRLATATIARLVEAANKVANRVDSRADSKVVVNKVDAQAEVAVKLRIASQTPPAMRVA